ncbi:DUF7266 family protein [Natronocalculus amylovorans]|uniref:Uncharacterized protein n=1 Tax=Natronocalculus amylovorans TaxID=2917812 RepID=A0AAE3FZW0_9EURY|nr:hypothetical protein [Natronocalculus amylovorans]MCL9818401.1 hypothetical protein [Natronocalculus amylovorans]
MYNGGTDRAVSVNIGYTINIVIMTVIFIGLISAAGSVIQSERQSVSATEMDVAGNQLAAEVMSVDRLARAGGDETVVQKQVRLPERISDEQYRISITENTIELSPRNDPLSVVVPYRSELPLVNADGETEFELPGGELQLRLTTDATVEVRSV